jgi:hypothetical protein
MNELSALDISCRLAARMVARTQKKVAEETHVPLPVLLDMIEGKREFNRRVLRYLGVRRKVIYLEVEPGDEEFCA